MNPESQERIARKATDEIGLVIVRNGLTPKGHELVEAIVLSAIRATDASNLNTVASDTATN